MLTSPHASYMVLAKVCNCGNVFADDAIFCRKCGAKRKSELEDKCVCGNIFASDALFCRKCGLKRPYKQLGEHPKPKCVCGNIYAPDSVFCRKCGIKRPMFEEGEHAEVVSVHNHAEMAVEAVKPMPTIEPVEKISCERFLDCDMDEHPPLSEPAHAGPELVHHVIIMAPAALESKAGLCPTEKITCERFLDCDTDEHLPPVSEPAHAGPELVHHVIIKAPAALESKAGLCPTVAAEDAADTARREGKLPSEVALAAGAAVAESALADGSSPAESGRMAAAAAKTHDGSPADVARAAGRAAAKAAASANQVPQRVVQEAIDAAKAAGGSSADVLETAADSGAQVTIAAAQGPAEAAKVVELVLQNYATAERQRAARDAVAAVAAAQGMSPVAVATVIADFETVAQCAASEAEPKAMSEVAPEAALAAGPAAPAEKAAGDKSGHAEVLCKLEVTGQGMEDKYEAIFNKIDTSGDGQLSASELRAAVGLLAELGVGSIETFLAEADSDGDGEVSRDEFKAYFTYVNMDREACYNALFDAVDLDGSGDLSFQEIRDYPWYKYPKLCQNLGIVNWHSAVAGLQRADKKKDGLITRDEFVSYFKEQQRTASGNAWAEDATEGGKVTKPQAAWKQARLNPAYSRGAKRKANDDFNKCWDFVAGYCYRGRRCHYKHDLASKADQATLDSHHEFCVRVAMEAGVNLSAEAHTELQTLTESDAEALIRSLGDGGTNEHVWDKSGYVIHRARRTRMQAGGKAHPDWEWYHGKHKRARW